MERVDRVMVSEFHSLENSRGKKFTQIDSLNEQKRLGEQLKNPKF